MPYLAAVWGFSSTLSFTILTLPLSVPAISSSAGAIMRHGPHHSAQKSTTTGSVAFNTSESKVASETLPTAMARTSFAQRCRRGWEPNRGWEANLGTRSVSVKAASSRRDGGKRGVQAHFGNLHEIRHIGPYEHGANALVRIELPEHCAIKRKLLDVSRRYVGEATRRGPVGLIVGNQDGIAGHREPVDLTGHGKRAALQASNDGNLGATPRRKQRREAPIIEQSPDLVEHEFALLGRKVSGRSGKIAPRRFGACRRRNVWQRLQQPVHHRSPRQCLVAIDARAGGPTAPPRGLVVSGRRREDTDSRRLRARLVPEPGWWPIGSYRHRGSNEGFLRRDLRLAIAPHHPVAVTGRLLDRDRRLERREHQVPPAALGPQALALGAANDQAVDGARHCDVEQTPIFVFGLASRAFARFTQWGDVVRLCGSPNEAVRRMRRRGRQRQKPRLTLRRARGRRDGICENDDRRFQTLSAMHRHHSHLVPGDLHVALHLGLCRAQPCDETLQRRCLSLLVVERELEEFVERIVRLVTEPGEEALAPAFGTQHARIERERHFPRPLGIAPELGDRVRK